MIAIRSFKPYSDTEAARYLASHYPKGKLTAKRYLAGSVLNNLIVGCARFVSIVMGQIFDLAKNRDIDQADELLPEWEESVGVPEQIPRRDDLDGRREAVRRLRSKVPVYNIQSGDRVVDAYTTIEEFVRLTTGEVITISKSEVGSSFPVSFPIQFSFTGGRVNFFLIIGVLVEGTPANNQFPLTFPMSFFDPSVPEATQDKIDKALEKVVPSFMDWTYQAIVEGA